MALKRTLTADQQKVLDDTEASFVRAYEEAKAKLSAAGFDCGPGSTNGSFQCFRCDCEGYLRGPGLKCKRPGCGHGFTSHDVR